MYPIVLYVANVVDNFRRSQLFVYIDQDRDGNSIRFPGSLHYPPVLCSMTSPNNVPMDIIQCNLLVKTKRRWKSRWVVLRRVTSASDRINLYVYKNRLSSISKQKEKLFFPLREFCGMESIDKENKSPKLVIINATQPLSLRFEKKEDRDHWVDTIVTEGNFGEDVTFDGILASKKSGEVTLHIYPDFFALVRKQNCRCVGRWHLHQLFNYATVDAGFVFQVENEEEEEEGAEPESFLLLTSFEKQINRAFDTLYKSAGNVYGSAEGIQRRPKSPTGSEPKRRPRSMSEPSGFKRFMHRLSFRRRSRRPKKPKMKTGSLGRQLDVEGESGSTPRLHSVKSLSNDGSRQDIAKNSTSDPSRSASLSDEYEAGAGSPAGATSASVLVNVRPHPVDEANGGSTGRQTNGKTIHSSDSEDNSTKTKKEGARNRENENFCDSGNRAVKTSVKMKESLSIRPARTDGLAASEDDLSVWQRRSALLLNTDDMIEQGFIKVKPVQRRRSSDSSTERGAEGNNDPERYASMPTEAGKEPAVGLRQARANTIGSRRRMPNLTIEITPSGSDPALNQYVNVAHAVKNKQIPKLKQGEWDRYDSEENVYHRLEAVVGPLGYENVPGKSKSVNSLSDASYRNLPATFPNGGHSYENVSGAPSESARMHYVNVEAKKRKNPFNANYIRVEGSAGPATPIQIDPNYSPVSRKPNVNTDYREIDPEKTRQLRELAEQRERAKKN